MKKLLLSLTLALSLLTVSCGGERGASAVVTEKGAIIHGPGGAVLEIPAGALAAGSRTTFSLRTVESDEDPGVGIGTLCGDAYLVSPSSARFEKPARLTLPDPGPDARAACEHRAFFFAPPGRSVWSALDTVTASGTVRSAMIDGGGIAGIGSVHVTPANDTSVYVGSRIVPVARDAMGRDIVNTWAWTKSLNTDMIKPDDDIGDGLQRAKREGMGALVVAVPPAGYEKTLAVRILPNPAERIRVIRGKRQEATAGAMLPDSLIAEVSDDRGVPLPGIWVQVYYRGKDGAVILGAGPSDARGRFGLLAQAPRAPGTYAFRVRVAGVGIEDDATITARGAE